MNESEARPSYAPVPTSIAVQRKTVKGSVIAKSHPKSPGSMKPSNLKYTHRNESLTSTISKTVANTEKDIKIINKVISRKIMMFRIAYDIIMYRCF